MIGSHVDWLAGRLVDGVEDSVGGWRTRGGSGDAWGWGHRGGVIGLPPSSSGDVGAGASTNGGDRLELSDVATRTARLTSVVGEAVERVCSAAAT